jgi:hypothetical protein
MTVEAPRLRHVDTASAANRLRLALDMYEVGERMQRQRLRRRHPDASPAEIEAEVRAWRARRPGNAAGGHPGHASHRFG